MKRPTLAQLRTLLAVVETGNLSLAAKRLHLTQSAVSQQVGELERTLGQRLLERLPGGVVPTATGEGILEAARRALAAAEDVVTLAAEHGEGHRGRVRIGTGGTTSAFLLPDVLARAKLAMPGLEIRVTIGNTVDLLGRIESGELDVGLLTLPVPTNRYLEVELLAREPLLAFLPPPGEPEGDAVGPEHLAALPLILYESGGHTRRVSDGWFAEAGLAPVPIMEIGSVETIRRMVRNGLGATILPALALSEEKGRPLDPPLWRELAVVTRADKRRDRALRLFLEELHHATEPLRAAASAQGTREAKLEISGEPDTPCDARTAGR